MVVSLSEDSIPTNYSDEQWQRDLIELKRMIKPSTAQEMYVIEDAAEIGVQYWGKSQYQYFCDFINDILSNIRQGGTDYCFYVYQVAELLKYEHDRLNAKWDNEERCFILSLNADIKVL